MPVAENAAARIPFTVCTEDSVVVKHSLLASFFIPMIRCQVLLVLDAMNALIKDDSSGEAYENLGDFVDQLCGASPHLKLLVTNENIPQTMTGRRFRYLNENVSNPLELYEKVKTTRTLITDTDVH